MGAVSYLWQINAYDGNGPQDYSDNPLLYSITNASGYDAVLKVSVGAPGSCFETYPIRIRSSAGPHINNISATISGCAVSHTDIIVGAAGSEIDVTPYSSEFTASLGVGETTFIPDGPNCATRCYESSVTFTDFPIGSTITSADDVLYLKINMEHTFIGDMQISLEGPNNCGSVIILPDFYTTAQGGYDNFTYSWPYSTWQGYTRIGFGNSNAADVTNPQSPCNSALAVNLPGTGWDYCWSDNPTYSYANGNGFVYEASNMSVYTGTPKYRVNQSNVNARSNFYHPKQSFGQLAGCPLNGEWTVKVCDTWAKDNGWIFNWDLALRDELIPDPWGYQSNIDHVEWNLGTNASASLTSGIPGQALVYELQPSPGLASGNYSGTFMVYDEWGCGTNATINYSVAGIPEPPTVAVGDYVWAGFEGNEWNNTTNSNWLVKTASGYDYTSILPDNTKNVFIIDNCANSNPEIVANSTCRNITILAGKTLSLGNNTLNVKGNWNNLGTLIQETALLYFLIAMNNQ